ncbi:calcium/proton exchanger [Tanacetum coccineum]
MVFNIQKTAKSNAPQAEISQVPPRPGPSHGTKILCRTGVIQYVVPHVPPLLRSFPILIVKHHEQQDVEGLDPLEIMNTKEKIDVVEAESLDPCVCMIQDEKYGWKYGCGAKGWTQRKTEYVYVHAMGLHISLRRYVEGGFKVVNDIQFEDMRIGELFQVVTRNNQNIDEPDYVSEEYDEDPNNIDFHVEGEHDVVFQKLSIDDPFLTKLLKNALADYGVKHGYQLWYYRSDYKSLRVYCGRDIELGRCSSRRGMKKKKKGVAEGDKVKGKQAAEASHKVKGKQVAKESDLVKGNREARASPKKPMKWTRMRVLEHKGHHCPFRLWASWMSSERTFQIKTLYSNHRCTRNYNMGPLVTFRWIARHYARDIILNLAISYKFIREDIREKYMVDVSLGQCKRAKQCALYEHDGCLIEHYRKLWDYQQAVLDSNPGLTCHLDVDVHDNGQNCFHRFYACFKGVKDGWLSGCRKVIRIDGSFITHVCKGEELTVMGRDENNQMYPIAWSVVDVEKTNNWCWFLSLLADDLQLEEGLRLTIISDSHKGLIDAVRTWLPQAEHKH